VEAANNTVIGKRRENQTLEPVIGKDPWAEAPFYALSQDGETNSEHLLPWTKDMTIAANFHGLRVANKDKAPTEQRDYAVFKTDDGMLLRAYTPGQLKYALEQIEVGTYVEITYLGKEYVERLKKDIHQFDVKAPSPSNH
jgi:hypothetical protein